MGPRKSHFARAGVNLMQRGILAVLALLLSLIAPHAARAWWNADWDFRKKIVLNTGTAGIPADDGFAQSPILLRLHAGNFRFLDMQDDGAALRIIAADDRTPLPFHIDHYDWVNELAYIWVQPPKLGGAGAPPFIWLYFGNEKATPAGDAKATWDTNQTLVFHFSGKEPLPRDATGFANNASRSTATIVPVGQIDAAARYNGGQFTTVPASPSLKLSAATGFTFSAWVRSEASQSAILFQQQDGARSLTIALDNDQPVAKLTGDDGVTIATPARARLATGEWHHLAVTLSDRLVVYLDGVEAAAIPVTPPGAQADFAGDIWLGGTPTAANGFNGMLDEVRLANVARTAGWLKLEALTAAADSKLLSYGEDEQAHSVNSTYLQTILLLAGAVSLDGWIVIALIGVLGFISGEVAISKAFMLRRTIRANDRFLRLFRDQGADALTESSAIAGDCDESPLFAVYTAGVEEFGRVRQSLSDMRRFNSLSLEVVRAAVDSSLVKEADRINERMVLLTLAVSGAPFLGLLGTVVGIMITFATIALKGDVNINTIAPGIAAALTATTAGMLVAIPALFGYNVLMTRIKSVTTVMETFREELLSKIAASVS
jgi:biopolymer transport protein ExbB